MSAPPGPRRRIEPPPGDDRVRVVFAEQDDPIVLDRLGELLLRLLLDPKAK
jgi:hypothetical protein